jgi:hypothetical protein
MYIELSSTQEKWKKQANESGGQKSSEAEWIEHECLCSIQESGSCQKSHSPTHIPSYKLWCVCI